MICTEKLLLVVFSKYIVLNQRKDLSYNQAILLFFTLKKIYIYYQKDQNDLL